MPVMQDFPYDDFVLDLLETAEQAKIDGNHEEAILILNKIIFDVPECNEAFEEIGDNYISLKDNNKAQKALDQALKVNPESSNAHYLMGFLYSLQQKWILSVEELEIAYGLSPNHPEILRCLGWALYNQNQKSKGIALLERANVLCPNDANILCDLGVCCMNSNELDKAEMFFQQVLALSPHSEQAKECLVFLRALRAKQIATKKHNTDVSAPQIKRTKKSNFDS